MATSWPFRSKELRHIVQALNDLHAAGGGGGGGTPASTVVAETSYGQGTVVGVGTNYAREDHSHGSPALGTTATTAAAGNDARLSDSRNPTGTASGDLSGTYPGPTIAALAVTDAKVAAANKDGLTTVASMRTLGTGAQQAAAGNDSRLSDARTPTAHATTHQPGGSDAMAVDAVAATGSLRTLGTGAQQAAAGTHTHTAISTVQDEGIALTQRATINFAGAGVTATDDAVNSRTLVTIPGGAAGADAKSYNPGSFTVATEQFQLHGGHLKLTGTARGTLQGTSRMVVSG